MINYNILHESTVFYESKGFSRVESPWLVTDAIDSITRPKGVVPYTVSNKGKNLVASGEQSFLYMYLKDFLPKGKFQTITPCFRNESFDFTHSKYFMKNELIQTKDVNKESLEIMVSNAIEFFSKYIDVEIVTTSDGFDLNWGQYELGSYGIRSCEFLDWIYGTGCAEPRLTKIINLSQK